MKLTRKPLSLAQCFDLENNAQLTTLSADASAPDSVKVSPENAPDEILLLPWGTQPEPLNYVVVDGNTTTLLPKMQSALDAVTIPVLDPGDPTLQENSKTSVEEPFQVGSGRVVVRDKDGIYLTDIKWLDEGRAALAEFPCTTPTVWLQGDLVTDDHKSVVGVKSVMFSTRANQITMLDAPKLANLSAATATAGYNRLCRAMNAEAESATTDRVKLIKMFAATGRFPRHENGQPVTEQQMRILNIEALRFLFNRTPVSSPQNKEEIIRCFSSAGKFPIKTNGQKFTVDELKALDLPMLRMLHANVLVPPEGAGIKTFSATQSGQKSTWDSPIGGLTPDELAEAARREKQRASRRAHCAPWEVYQLPL